MSSRLGVSICVLFVGCLGGSGTPDAGDAGPRCESNDACDDGVFCNGLELCAPDEPSAAADGCLVGSPPCGADTCREDEARCEVECPDLDGDGFEDRACGGTDCDDTDRNTFPGATEVCDQAGIDDDCDPETLGLDRDGDGFPSTLCCNGSGGDLRCGADCDDMRASANPDAAEVCNGLDDDCDGMLDEGVTITFYRDADGDSYGDVTVTMEACSPPTGWTILSGDCDDASPNVSPGRPESCLVRGVDDDCDGNVDEICDCSPVDPPITCGPGAPLAGRGVCRDGSQVCSSAGTYGDCMGGVYPGEETCDGLDEDCDGRVDEGSGRACAQGASVSGTTACGRAGVRRCGADCQWLDSEFLAAGETTESCDYCVDTSSGWPGEQEYASETVSYCRAGFALSSCPFGGVYAPVTVHGDAVVMEGWGGIELNAGLSTGAGSGWFPSVRLGYGETTVRAEVVSSYDTASSAAFGWAVSFVRDETVTTGPAAAFGAPSALLSARWRHAAPGYPTRVFTIREDGTQVRSLESSNAATEPSASRPRAQRFSVAIAVDDPSTVANETSVSVYAFSRTTDAMGFHSWTLLPGSGSPQLGCGACFGCRACGFSLRAGDAIRVVMSGGGLGSPGVRHLYRELEVITSDACPVPE